MPEIMSFGEAIADSNSNGFSKRHLLLGNGFSIGCRADIFHYASLFGEADFDGMSEARRVFDALKTQDFELSIKSMENGAKILPVYLPEAKATASLMLLHAQQLKDLLVTTIAGNHPENPLAIPDEKFWACRKFLSYFLGDSNNGGQVYTLNYDLLLYWTLMHDDMPFDDPINLDTNDGFGNDEDDFDADYVVWQGDSGSKGQRVHYLHGALHLFDSGSDLKKYTWNRSGQPLVQQARTSLERGYFPLFVAEGTSAQKKNKIRHNAYLHHSFKSFVGNVNQQKPCFFIFGHSMAKNDDHILKKIGYGKFKKLYVGIYGDPGSEGNNLIINRANGLAAQRNERYPLDIVFFDSSSANVWGSKQ
ncbi:MAG: DUF4917 family protein [Nitrosomonas sp.]|nr:DUF4917 family protein [Nitrosomonas sp.]